MSVAITAASLFIDVPCTYRSITKPQPISVSDHYEADYKDNKKYTRHKLGPHTYTLNFAASAMKKCTHL